MTQQAIRNRLLSAPPAHERDLIEAHSTLVRLNRRAVLYDSARPLEHVYFIEDAIVSILSLVSDRTGVETATIGREGTVGMAAFHGVNASPERAMVQVPGTAYRIDVSAFRELLPK